MSREQMNNLEAEFDTQLKFANCLIEELAEYQKRANTLTAGEKKRVDEIHDILAAKNAWLKKAQAERKAFYKPAMVG